MRRLFHVKKICMPKVWCRYSLFGIKPCIFIRILVSSCTYSEGVIQGMMQIKFEEPISSYQFPCLLYYESNMGDLHRMYIQRISGIPGIPGLPGLPGSGPSMPMPGNPSMFGAPGSSSSSCMPFPFNCPTVSLEQIITPPVDIPYCQRFEISKTPKMFRQWFEYSCHIGMSSILLSTLKGLMTKLKLIE